MKKYFYIFAIITFTLTSCEKNEIGNVPTQQTIATTITDDANRQARPVILGDKLNNPYSIANMKAALDTLKAHPEQQSTCMKAPSSTLDDITIEPTDLYVRYLPADSAQFVKLMTDSTLILFDYPLDYKKIQTGDYYKDPSITGKYTWLYATVPTGYQPPSGIQYEIIEKLFIPEHSPYYSQEETPSNVKGIRNIKSYAAKEANYADVLKTLEAISFIITGNGDQLNKPTTGNTPAGMQKATSYVTKRFLWWSWQEAVYNPEGYIKVSTPYGDQPLANIKVRVARYFTAYETRTNSQGKFYFKYDQFGQDAIFPNIEYFVYFDGYNGINSWKLCDNLFGAAILWTSGLSLGVHSPDNYSMTFDTWSYYWGEAVQYNAIYKYNDIASIDGISPPTYNLEIATLKSDNYTSAAPLFKNHIDVTNVAAIILQLYGFLPDLILRYENDMNDYYKITHFAWHELTHASQLESMIENKGYWWASGYWGANAGQQAWNSMFNGGSYGSVGADNWEIIALSEGWANFREWKMAKDYLGWNTFPERSWSEVSYDLTYFCFGFPYKYAVMFYKLNNIGCSDWNLEKSLSAYSIQSFKENLLSIYPSNVDAINVIMKDYE